MLNNAHSIPWKAHAKFQPGWSFDWLLIEKQLPVGVAMTKPHPLSHPHVLNNANPVPCKPHAKFVPGLSFILLLIAKQLPVGVAMANHTHMLLIMLTRVLEIALQFSARLVFQLDFGSQNNFLWV